MSDCDTNCSLFYSLLGSPDRALSILSAYSAFFELLASASAAHEATPSIIIGMMVNNFPVDQPSDYILVLRVMASLLELQNYHTCNNGETVKCHDPSDYRSLQHVMFM